MKYAALLFPLLFCAVFVFALVRKVRLYDCFTAGVKDALPFALSVFPYLAAVLILAELFERSGLSQQLTRLLSPLLSRLGIPPEIGTLALIKPFSGSGSTAVLSDLLAAYGADSYIGRCACVAYGSSETVFFLSALYFSGKNASPRAIAFSLIGNFLGLVAGCLVCRFL